MARGDLYAEGWIAGVSDKLDQFAGNARDAALIARYMEQNHSGLEAADIKSRVKGKNVTHNDWHQGRAAGRQAELNQGVQGRAARPLLTA